MVAVCRVHGLHILRYYLILTLLAVVAIQLMVRLRLVLDPSGSQHLLLHLHAVRWHVAGRVLAIKAVIVLLLHILGPRSSPNTHIVEADLTLMTLPCHVCRHRVVVLL
jgi:hypothetical protein